jgi:hypothetical protein
MSVAKKKSSLKKAKRKDFHLPHYRTDITEEELIVELSPELQEAWRELRRFAAQLGEQRIYASGRAIMFSKKVCYLFVRPKKSYLETCIFLPDAVDSPAIARAQKVSKTRVANTFKLTHADQVEEPLTDWVREAFETTEPHVK